MKIIKIDMDKERGFLTVWTDAVENTGFNFRIEEIADKADLTAKVKARVQAYLDEEQAKQDAADKFEPLTSLIGQEI